LQIARAQKMTGGEASARKWHEEFLALWKDGDPDVPSLNKPKPSTPSAENDNPHFYWFLGAGG
jgi:hypothetical protein